MNLDLLHKTVQVFRIRNKLHLSLNIYILGLNLHQANICGAEIIQNDFSIKLKSDCKFEMYMLQCDWKCCILLLLVRAPGCTCITLAFLYGYSGTINIKIIHVE